MRKQESHNEINHFYDFLLSMALSKPVPVGKIYREQEDAVPLSLCNEIITNIIGSHIGLVVNPHFFLLPIEITINNIIYFKLNNEQDLINKLRKYNTKVRSEIKNGDNVDVGDYYSQESFSSTTISPFANQILRSCNVLEQSYNILLTFKLYRPQKDTYNQITKYCNLNYLSLEKEQKETVVAYLKKVCIQCAYNLEHKIHHKQINKSAVSAAISQVMARNLSHNIGSHVFANLIENRIYDNLDEKINRDTYQPRVINKDRNNHLAYFNQYLKSRMDYLSEVTFGTSNILTTKKIYNDLFLELDRVRILLNHISGINTFQFKFELKCDNNISAAFPSDVLGCQAFYNIIENIVRNTAKHTKNREGIKTFTINIQDISDKQPNLPQDYQQYYCVEIDDGIPVNNIEALVQKQNGRLNCSVLGGSEKNKLRSHSLGLLEMEASAIFLRQMDLAKIESPDYDIDSSDEQYANSKGLFNIIKAFKTKNNALGYRFFIKKPQEFLFVGDWNITTETKAKLLNQGIWFKSEDSLLDDLKKGIAFAHRFVVTIKTEDEFFTGELATKKYEYKTLLPNRWLYIGNDNIDAIANLLKAPAFDILGLEAKIWELFLDKDLSLNEVSLQNEAIDQQETIKLEEKQIVLTDHTPDKYCEFIAAKQKNPNIKTWIEPLSSNAQSKLPFFHLSDNLSDYIKTVNSGNFENDKIHQIIKGVLWDSYSNPILAVDERIQEYSKTEHKIKDRSYTNKDVFLNSGVIIPDKELTESNDDLIQSINSDIEACKPAFILIHYGILERFYSNDKGKIIACLLDWTENKNCIVVVTSGRGKHSLELPEYVRFLNLSSVLYAFVENQNKYLMNYTLNQARR